MTIIIGVVHFERFVSGDIENYESKKRKLVAVAVAVEHIRTRSGSAYKEANQWGLFDKGKKKFTSVFCLYYENFYLCRSNIVGMFNQVFLEIGAY